VGIINKLNGQRHASLIWIMDHGKDG